MNDNIANDNDYEYDTIADYFAEEIKKMKLKQAPPTKYNQNQPQLIFKPKTLSKYDKIALIKQKEIKDNKPPPSPPPSEPIKKMSKYDHARIVQLEAQRKKK